MAPLLTVPLSASSVINGVIIKMFIVRKREIKISLLKASVI